MNPAWPGFCNNERNMEIFNLHDVAGWEDC